MASEKNVEMLVTDRLTVNRAVLNSLNAAGVLSKKQLEYVGLTVIKQYRERAETLSDEEGLTKAESREEVLENKKLLVNRVQMATLQEITKTVKENYHGEYYIWLPSTAKNPDPNHMKKYGKRYLLGRGEAPGDRYGCQCGMEILVKEKKLKLKED